MDLPLTYTLYYLETGGGMDDATFDTATYALEEYSGRAGDDVTLYTVQTTRILQKKGI